MTFDPLCSCGHPASQHSDEMDEILQKPVGCLYADPTPCFCRKTAEQVRKEKNE